MEKLNSLAITTGAPCAGLYCIMSFEETVDYKNLLNAGLKCCNKGRWKPSVQSFEMTLLRRTSRNKSKLINGTYKPHKTNNFTLKERGKIRCVKAHKIQDRQVYKSFCNHEIKPSTQNRIVPTNSASQEEKGTEHSIKQFRQGLAKATRKWKNDFYVITLDYHDYFGSMPHASIVDTIYLSDEASELLLKQYVNSFEGDKGIGIGGEPSQNISIVYPSKIDRMLYCEKCVIASGRYMDDSYAIVHTKDEARYVLNKIRVMSDSLGLIINEKRTKISWMKRDTVLWLKKRTTVSETGKIKMRLTRKNVRDEIRRIKYHKTLVESGDMPRYIPDVSIECWCSYARPYDSNNQMIKVLKYYSDAFDVPWDLAKILLKRRHTGWIKMCEQRYLQYGTRCSK